MHAGGHRFESDYLHTPLKPQANTFDKKYSLAVLIRSLKITYGKIEIIIALIKVISQAFDQATKGIRWMPWRQEAMKDVISCDKLRGAAK